MQVFHCFGVLVSRAEPSLSDCHEINVGINDMVGENVCFIANGTGVDKAQHDSWCGIGSRRAEVIMFMADLALVRAKFVQLWLSTRLIVLSRFARGWPVDE